MSPRSKCALGPQTTAICHGRRRHQGDRDSNSLFVSQVAPGLKVSQIRVRSGELLDLLEFVMADGTIENGGHYTDGGMQRPWFDLGPDEHIVRIEARQRAESLVGLRIHTSKGRESEWYGGIDGDAEEFVGSAEDPIVGFGREAGRFCPRLTRVQRLRESVGGFEANVKMQETTAVNSDSVFYSFEGQGQLLVIEYRVYFLRVKIGVLNK
jgi:hypothetical protein